MRGILCITTQLRVSTLHARVTWPVVASGVVLAWCVVASSMSLRVAAARDVDPMSRLEAEFLPFAAYLPATGDIGYLEQRDGSAEAIRTYYAAQYALVPRVVVPRVGPEFLIVAAGTEQPRDERLQGYRQVRAFPSGHRLFVRVP